MESYSISDVIRLLGLPPAPVGRLSYYIPCPCCDSGRDRHMNINLRSRPPLPKSSAQASTAAMSRRSQRTVLSPMWRRGIRPIPLC